MARQSDLTRTLLKLIRQTLQGELRKRKRRKNRSVVIIIALTVAIFALGYFLEQPAAPTPDQGARLGCDIVSIYDGDTATLNCDDGEIKVRVWGIDAPEMGQQPWGTRSRDRLRELLDSGEVTAEVVDIDRYDRVVARLYQNGQDAGLAMVRVGAAVVYEQYNDSDAYREAEQQARRRQAGVWSEDGAQQTPWQWRRVNARN